MKPWYFRPPFTTSHPELPPAPAGCVLVTDARQDNPWGHYGLAVLPVPEPIAKASDVDKAIESFFERLGAFVKSLSPGPWAVYISQSPNSSFEIPDSFRALLSDLGIRLLNLDDGDGGLECTNGCSEITE